MPLLLTAAQPQQDSLPAPASSRALWAADAALDKKAQDVLVMEMGNVSGVASFFVLATGTSDNQVRAIQESVEQTLRDKAQERPWHREGVEHRQWVLLDYVDVVVHIFSPELRAFYNLERLWSDAPQQRIFPAEP